MLHACKWALLYFRRPDNGIKVMPTQAWSMAPAPREKFSGSARTLHKVRQAFWNQANVPDAQHPFPIRSNSRWMRRWRALNLKSFIRSSPWVAFEFWRWFSVWPPSALSRGRRKPTITSSAPTRSGRRVCLRGKSRRCRRLRRQRSSPARAAIGRFYVPAQYDGNTPACVMIFQDGSGYVNETGPHRVPIVFDNLIHKKEMPVTIGIFINPGTKAPAQPGRQGSL